MTAKADRMTFRLATKDDSDVVGHLACLLLRELFPSLYNASDESKLAASAARLLDRDDRFWVVLAFGRDGAAESLPVGLMTLAESNALYAHDTLGEIMELYVDPDYRSSGMGRQLVEFGRAFGRERGWSYLEVGAPDVPRWQRTVDFYTGSGFEVVGPRLSMEL